MLAHVFFFQFYSSRKRKSLSPGLKSRRVEKDAKLTLECSPSAKGSLDNYLKTSREDYQTSKSTYAAQSLLAGQEPVKRNLSLEINRNSKDETKAQVQPQTSEAFKCTQEVTSQCSSKEGNDEVGCLVKDCSVSAHIPENSELKQFANEFLSLYCRYCTSEFWISSCYKLLISCFYILNSFGDEFSCNSSPKENRASLQFLILHFVQ